MVLETAVKYSVIFWTGFIVAGLITSFVTVMEVLGFMALGAGLAMFVIDSYRNMKLTMRKNK